MFLKNKITHDLCTQKIGKLLPDWGKYMWYVLLPDKIQEGIGWADLIYLLWVGELVLHPSPWSNSEHHDDTDDHSDDSGGSVVDHCSHSHFPRSTAIQSCHTCKRRSMQYFINPSAKDLMLFCTEPADGVLGLSDQGISHKPLSITDCNPTANSIFTDLVWLCYYKGMDS